MRSEPQPRNRENSVNRKRRMERPAFPRPTPVQAKLIWLAVSTLSLALFLAVVGALFWGLGWVVQRLTPVLLPLAIAGIIAYLLDPVVDYPVSYTHLTLP